MSDPRSEWSLVAACSSCREPFSRQGAAVLVRPRSIASRGVLIDVLGERWPEPGQLLHSRCCVRTYGRAALWASFVRGRFDKGVARRRASSASDHLGEVLLDEDAAWELSVSCCVCACRVEGSGAALVRDARVRQGWQWVPVLLERRPGQPQVSHLQCFVRTHGRGAAYAALGREAWKQFGPLIKNVGGALGL